MSDSKQEKIQKEWIDLNESVERILDELALIRAREGHHVSEEQRSKIRQYWKATSELLNFFTTVKVQHDVYMDPPPVSVLMRLTRLCEDLGTGIVSNQIQLARLSGGGRPLARWEREAISRAIFFLEQVEAGAIKCSAPIATVSACFNVTKQAVRGWKKRSHEICYGIQRPHENVIEQSMRNAGKKYSRRGRGAPSE